MNRDWSDTLGVFYIIQLHPEDDPLLVKLGWTADLAVRSWQHRVNPKAPRARIVGSWPCLRGWERRTILAVVGDRTRPVFGERYRCSPVESLVQRAQAFFGQTDRTAVPCPPFTKPLRASRPPIPVCEINGNAATAADVAQRLGVPRYAVYRMAESGRIPGYPQPRQPWHSPNRKRWLFKLSEVEAAYAKLARDAGDTAPPPAPDAP